MLKLMHVGGNQHQEEEDGDLNNLLGIQLNLMKLIIWFMNLQQSVCLIKKFCFYYL